MGPVLLEQNLITETYLRDMKDQKMKGHVKGVVNKNTEVPAENRENGRGKTFLMSR